MPNIIGANTDDYGGAWSHKDMTENMLDGDWPGVGTNWEPDDSSASLRAWYKPRTGITANEELELDHSTGWADSSTSNAPLKGSTQDGFNIGLNPWWLTGTGLDTNGPYGEVTYFPLSFGAADPSKTYSGAAAQIAQTSSSIGADNEHATVALLVRDASQEHNSGDDTSLFGLGGKYGTDPGYPSKISLYRNVLGGIEHCFGDSDNTDPLVGTTTPIADTSWTAAAQYTILISKIKLNADDSHYSFYFNGNSSEDIPLPLTEFGPLNDASSTVKFSQTNAFFLGQQGHLNNTATMSGNHDVRFMEAVVYAGEVPISDIRKLEGYFYHKYAGGASASPTIDSTHKYYNLPPKV